MLTRRRLLTLLTLVLAIAATLTLAACGDEEEDEGTPGAGGGIPAPATVTFAEGSTMAKIQQSGKLRVGTKFDQPLYGQRNPQSGQIEGFDAEIARLLAAKLGLKPDQIEFTESVSKNREPFIQEGRVDIVIATYTINDERKQVVDFAGPYYIAGQDIMVKKDNSDVTGVETLNGKNVCSVEGSTSEKNLREKAPQANVTLFETYSQCAEALRDGRVDAVTTDNVILLGLVDQSGGEFKLVGKPFTSEPYGIGLKKGDTDFRNFINDQLEAIYADGSWAAAYERTAGKVDENTPQPPPVDRYASQ